MYMAKICGWTDIYAFAETEDEAKKLAVAKKKERCKDDYEKPSKWNWDTVSEYYGTRLYEVDNGTVIVEI